MDESYTNSDDTGKKPLLHKNLNIKNGMTKYKMKLEEKKRQEKLNKLSQLDNSRLLYSAINYRSDIQNTGNCELFNLRVIARLFSIILYLM